MVCTCGSARLHVCTGGWMCLWDRRGRERERGRQKGEVRKEEESVCIISVTKNWSLLLKFLCLNTIKHKHHYHTQSHVILLKLHITECLKYQMDPFCSIECWNRLHVQQKLLSLPEGKELLDCNTYSTTGVCVCAACPPVCVRVWYVMGSGISVSLCICLSHGCVISLPMATSGLTMTKTSLCFTAGAIQAHTYDLH